MKKIISVSVLILLAVVVSMYAFSSNADSKKTEVGSDVESVATSDVSISDSKVAAYYFYTTARCASCYKIEQYTKEALDKYFSDELASGKLDFQMINVDEAQNKHYIQDYKLYTKSVVLSKVSGGKEVEFKNLEKVWHLLGSRDKFYQYIKDETNNFIN